MVLFFLEIMCKYMQRRVWPNGIRFQEFGIGNAECGIEKG
jgi:hypothetical protein